MVTYVSFIYDYQPLKQETYHIRITVEGDRLSYDNDARSPVANLLKTKLFLNSTISDVDKGVRFILADIKDYFLTCCRHRHSVLAYLA